MEIGIKTIVIAMLILIMALVIILLFFNMSGQSNSLAENVFHGFEKISPFKF